MIVEKQECIELTNGSSDLAHNRTEIKWEWSMISSKNVLASIIDLAYFSHLLAIEESVAYKSDIVVRKRLAVISEIASCPCRSTAFSGF